MNKKLRLLVTAKCHNKCPMCCNNQFDFEKIPVVDRLDYDEISITGGEPLLPDCNGKTMWLAHGIRNVFRTLGIPAPRLFLYTAWVDYRTLRNRSYDFDGYSLVIDLWRAKWKYENAKVSFIKREITSKEFIAAMGDTEEKIHDISNKIAIADFELKKLYERKQ